MRINTRDLRDAQLNWAVAVCEGVTPEYGPLYTGSTLKAWRDMHTGEAIKRYCSSFDHGMAVLIRNRVSMIRKHDGWWQGCIYDIYNTPLHTQFSRDFLEAGMRTLVASKLGEDIDLPPVFQDEIRTHFCNTFAFDGNNHSTA